MEVTVSAICGPLLASQIDTQYHTYHTGGVIPG